MQWEFARNWVLEAQYQGQSGVGLINSWDINAIPLNVSNDTNVLNTIFQATQNYKPYTQFGSINHFSNYGHNTYHGGTWRVEKRLSAGLSFNAFYTWSKSLNENEGDGGDAGITFYNRRLEKAAVEHRHPASLRQRDELRSAVRQGPAADEPRRRPEPRARRLAAHLDPDVCNRASRSQ